MTGLHIPWGTPDQIKKSIKVTSDNQFFCVQMIASNQMVKFQKSEHYQLGKYVVTQLDRVEYDSWRNWA